MKLLRTLIGAAILSLVAGTATALPLITVAPGNSPGGYLPLSAYGIGPIAGMGDDDIVNFNTLSFAYAGQSWDRIGIVSNGYAIVGGGDSGDVQWANTALPDPLAPTNILAPFWTDLNPAIGGALRIGMLTNGLDIWIVLEWDAVMDYSGLAANSFQIWIGIDSDAHPGEDITFVYGEVGDGDSGFLTVGANDITGLVGASYYFNGAGTLPVSGTELRVATSVSTSVPDTSVPEPATLGLLGVGLLAMAGLRRRRHAA